MHAFVEVVDQKGTHVHRKSQRQLRSLGGVASDKSAAGLLQDGTGPCHDLENGFFHFFLHTIRNSNDGLFVARCARTECI